MLFLLRSKKYIATNIRGVSNISTTTIICSKISKFGVKFSDGTDAKIFLLQITGLSR